MSGPTREQAIQWACDAGSGIGTSGRWMVTQSELERIVAIAYAAGQAAEREACAKVCDALTECGSIEPFEYGAAACADAIRARGAK